MVWQVVRATKIPVVGIGGILSAEDALEFLIAGASAVQIGTANFVNPQVTTDIIDGIEMYLAQRKIARIVDIIGTLETQKPQTLE
jgi:dihydroorotate dehydrogenase (NAD+) catalytic subunit